MYALVFFFVMMDGREAFIPLENFASAKACEDRASADDVSNFTALIARQNGWTPKRIGCVRTPRGRGLTAPGGTWQAEEE
jgi:hypothetical protein